MSSGFASLRFKVTKTIHAKQTFIVLVVILLLISVVIFRVNKFNSYTYDQAYYNTETASLKSVHFNQEAIEKIEALRDSNVNEPSVSLPSNRNNPFSE